MLCDTRVKAQLERFRHRRFGLQPTLEIAVELPVAERFAAVTRSLRSPEVLAPDGLDDVVAAARSPTIADMTERNFVDSFQFLFYLS